MAREEQRLERLKGTGLEKKKPVKNSTTTETETSISGNTATEETIKSQPIPSSTDNVSKSDNETVTDSNIDTTDTSSDNTDSDDNVVLKICTDSYKNAVNKTELSSLSDKQLDSIYKTASDSKITEEKLTELETDVTEWSTIIRVIIAMTIGQMIDDKDIMYNKAFKESMGMKMGPMKYPKIENLINIVAILILNLHIECGYDKYRLKGETKPDSDSVKTNSSISPSITVDTSDNLNDNSLNKNHEDDSDTSTCVTIELNVKPSINVSTGHSATKKSNTIYNSGSYTSTSYANKSTNISTNKTTGNTIPDKEKKSDTNTIDTWLKTRKTKPIDEYKTSSPERMLTEKDVQIFADLSNKFRMAGYGC